MRKLKKVAILASLVLGCGGFAFSAQAQESTAAPVSVKQIPVKPIWLKAEVVHFDSHSIVVRAAGSERTVLTFTYAASAQKQVEKAVNKGGYQRGDKVKIRYQPGQTVALAIHGKPSKAS
jgi:preprotein translocase subunit SecF